MIRLIPHKCILLKNGFPPINRYKGLGCTVRIKTTNGLTRILTRVRHVPCLKRTLISLGMLNSKGCSFVAHHGSLKMNGRQRVMLMGREVENLYVLLGKTDVVVEVIKPTRMLKPVKRSTQSVDKTALVTSMASTSYTKGEGEGNSLFNMTELVSFRFDEDGANDGDGVPRFIGDMNLGILRG